MPKTDKFSHTPSGAAFTELLLEVFKLNGLLLTEGDKLTKPFGLTSARWKVLGAIAETNQPLTVPQIGRRMGLTRQNVQRLVDAMADEGSVEYQENQDHKRAKLICITKKGQQQLTAIMQKQFPWANRCAKGVKQSDLKQALNVLRTLVTHLEEN